MFEFSGLPDYEVGIPFFDDQIGRYKFWLAASVEVCNFARSLPMVEYAVRSSVYAPLWLVLDPLRTMNSECLYRAYRSVLCEMDAHLNPPLSIEIWGAAIDAAFDQELDY